MNFIEKMNKMVMVASLLLCISLFLSCNQEDTALPPNATPIDTSFDRALAALHDFTKNQSGTRSLGREITDVESLTRSDLGAETRSASCEADQLLAYVVNFQGGGYAILGAEVLQCVFLL